MNRRRYALTIVTLALTALVLEALVGRAFPLRMPLAEIPFSISAWSGRAEPIPPDLLERTRPDDAISRRYRDANGGIVVLYIGYFTHEASRAQALSACQGDCTLLERGNEVVDTSGGSIAVTRVHVRQDASEAVVLYWFQHGDRALPDVYRTRLDSALRTILHRRSDGALVRISAPIDGSAQQARERCIAFAKTLFPLLHLYLPD